MRRKNWINKKIFLYGRYSKFNHIYNYLANITNPVDKYRLFFFCKKLILKKKIFTNLPFKLNLFYLTFLSYTFKISKRKIFFRTFYKVYKKNLLILNPSFIFLSQYFDYRSIFFKVLNINNVVGFFIYKNLFKNTNYQHDHNINYINYIGYNFYLINSRFETFNTLNNIFKSKEYNSIGKIKLFSQDYNKDYVFNYYFIYNIHLSMSSELYKILICVYIHKLNSFCK